MSKGIIVVDDIPKSCEECRVSVFYECGIGFCKAKREYIDSDEPGWCPIKPAKQWIPVEERLPETEGVYDVTVINGKGESIVVTWQFLAGKHLSGNQTYVDGEHYWASNYTGDPINPYLSKRVIAWAERPEPYRPEEATEWAMT